MKTKKDPQKEPSCCPDQSSLNQFTYIENNIHTNRQRFFGRQFSGISTVVMLPLAFVSLMLMFSLVPLEDLMAQADCTHTPKTLVTTDGSCPGYPSDLELAKLDEGIDAGDSKIVYLKVCGSACCGEVLVNPKAGTMCYYNLYIAGPTGTGVSATGIGYADDACDLSEAMTCDDDPQQAIVYCSGGQIGHRITFLGWVLDDDEPGCSYWYYLVESNVSGCSGFPAISHLTFGYADDEECCSVLCDITPPEDICDGETSEICVDVTPGVPPYTYSWSASNGGNIVGSTDGDCIDADESGTYTVTVTDDVGCTAVCSTDLVVNDNPTCNVGDETVCEGENATFTASSGTGYTYSWSTGATTQSITIMDVSLGDDGNEYCVTITDANGCTSSCCGTLTVNANPDCEVDDETVCEGENATFTASAGTGYTYSWSTGATTQSITIMDVSLGDDGNEYCVTITDANGCSSSCCGTLTVNANPDCEVDDETVCEGEDATFEASAGTGYTYSWSTGATTQSITIMDVSLGDDGNEYCVTITDANGCTSSCCGTLTVNANPDCEVDDETVCEGEDATFEASAGTGYTYSWSTGATTQSITIMDVSLADDGNEYCVTITDANGCTSSCCGTLTVNENPECQITGTLVICGEGGTTEICASPADSYLWNTGAVTQCIEIGEGSYSVTITDVNGCTSVCSTDIPTVLPPACEVNDETVCEGEDAIFTATDGEGYTYSWSTGATTQSITVKEVETGDAGSYCVTITDGNGCISTCCGTLTVNANPDCEVDDETVCEGEDATFTASAGTGYTYSWSTGATTQSITIMDVSLGDDGNEYCVTITDANGCSSTCCGTLTVNENPDCEVNDETVCEGEDAIFTASAGTGYTYSWSTGATTQSITVMDVSLGDDGNQYCVTITDANGCSSTCCGTLTVIEAPECAISISDSDDCGGTAVTLEVSDEFDAEWSTGAMTNSITVGAGTYCVTITDANGCTDECCYTVEEECGTSWAREINGASTCFDDLGSYCNNAVQLQWGWTTEIQRGTDVQNVYEFEILEGAPGWCQGSGSLGDVVGHATVSWGPDNGGVPIVNIDLDDGEHYTDVVHIYMGCDPLPKKGPNCTAAPGQLGCTYQYDNETSILITDLDACWDMDSQCDDPGDYAWIAIHTVTCDLVCAPDLPALAVESELFDPQESQFEFWGEVSAYPVPANDELTIEFTAPQRGDVSIELINLIGQQVNKVYRSDTDAGYHHIVKLDIHDLPPGVYMYILRNNALMYSNKIIISGQ